MYTFLLFCGGYVYSYTIMYHLLWLVSVSSAVIGQAIKQKLHMRNRVAELVDLGTGGGAKHSDAQEEEQNKVKLLLGQQPSVRRDVLVMTSWFVYLALQHSSNQVFIAFVVHTILTCPTCTCTCVTGWKTTEKRIFLENVEIDLKTVGLNSAHLVIQNA